MSFHYEIYSLIQLLNISLLEELITRAYGIYVEERLRPKQTSEVVANTVIFWESVNRLDASQIIGQHNVCIN